MREPEPYPPKPQPIRLPSTKQIDARIKRQTLAYQRWRTQYLRLKDDTGHGRTHAGPRPVKPPPFVTTEYAEGNLLIFTRPPFRRDVDFKDPDHEPEGTQWDVPCAGVDPIHGPLYYLDSMMVLKKQLLRTIPSKHLLIVRGRDPQSSLVFKAIQQEWQRWPSPNYAQVRGKDPKKSVVGLHRYLCYIVKTTVR